MTRNDSISSMTLNEAIDRVVATYGALPVLARTLRATFRLNRPPPLTDAETLSDFVRRDVGLGPKAPSASVHRNFF